MRRYMTPLFAALILGAVFSFTTAHSSLDPVSAQEIPDACTVPLARAQGGDTIRISSIQVTVPTGYTYQWGPFVIPGGLHLRVCVIEYASEVTINALTGKETARVVKNPAAGPILDQIVASARLIQIPGQPTWTPTPLPTSTPTPAQPPVAIQPQSQSGTSLITPPSTGDAGLSR